MPDDTPSEGAAELENQIRRALSGISAAPDGGWLMLPLEVLGVVTGYRRLRDRLAAAEAREKALREALENIAEPAMEICACRCNRCRREAGAARAALAETGEREREVGGDDG